MDKAAISYVVTGLAMSDFNFTEDEAKFLSEQLKYGAQGAWSRRITDEHRLVYLVDGEDLIILQARYHY